MDQGREYCDTVYLQWKDNKLVSFASTMHTNVVNRSAGSCKRRVKVNGQCLSWFMTIIVVWVGWTNQIHSLEPVNH